MKNLKIGTWISLFILSLFSFSAFAGKGVIVNVDVPGMSLCVHDSAFWLAKRVEGRRRRTAA